MAHPDNGPRPVLTASRLTLLHELTRALSDAVLEGDLQRAEWLLVQRRAALDRLDPAEPLDGELQRELDSLWQMERELLEFCRTWREIVKERLAGLASHHALRSKYQLAALAPPLVDMKK